MCLTHSKNRPSKVRSFFDYDRPNNSLVELRCWRLVLVGIWLCWQNCTRSLYTCGLLYADKLIQTVKVVFARKSRVLFMSMSGSTNVMLSNPMWFAAGWIGFMCWSKCAQHVFDLNWYANQEYVWYVGKNIPSEIKASLYHQIVLATIKWLRMKCINCFCSVYQTIISTLCIGHSNQLGWLLSAFIFEIIRIPWTRLQAMSTVP